MSKDNLFVDSPGLHLPMFEIGLILLLIAIAVCGLFLLRRRKRHVKAGGNAPADERSEPAFPAEWVEDGHVDLSLDQEVRLSVDTAGNDNRMWYSNADDIPRANNPFGVKRSSAVTVGLTAGELITLLQAYESDSIVTVEPSHENIFMDREQSVVRSVYRHGDGRAVRPILMIERNRPRSMETPRAA